jgi:Fe-S cluster assembly protein SufB
MPTPSGPVHYPPIDYQAISYFSAPKKKERAQEPRRGRSDPAETYEKLGIPLEEQKALAGVAVDAVFDSVSVATTFREKLAEAGVIFCSISEAVQDHPELVQKYLGSVVPPTDNFYAGSTPRCSPTAPSSTCRRTPAARWSSAPTSASTPNTGQFERTLIVADEGSYVSYLEGCTAPQRDENQLHAAVVELVAMDDAEIKYSTVQNWYPGDENGKGGIYNFVTKRGDCRGERSKISWTQVETGSAITWKYPSCILRGDNSVGEFYSVAVTKGRQQADTGTKMIHIGKNTSSTIVSKGISASTAAVLPRAGAHRRQGRGRAQPHPVRLPADRRQVRRHTFPYIEVKNPTRRWSTRRPRRRSATTSSSTAAQRGLSRRTRCR